MECKGVVIFKGIEKKSGGNFTNEKGQTITFDGSYVVKFDETINGKIDERKLKFPRSNVYLYREFKKLKPYTPIYLYCDVEFGFNTIKLIPIHFEASKDSDIGKYTNDNIDDEIGETTENMETDDE